MSLDKSLKSSHALERHRNVLTRAERIQKLKDEVLWEEGASPFALPKVAHRKTSAGAKDKKAAPTAADAEAGTEAGPTDHSPLVPSDYA